MKSYNRNDVLWISIVSTIILFWGFIPTWAGYRAEIETLRFRGLYYDSQDYAVHIAMMEAGRHGETAYQFKFTAEPHDPKYVRMFYIALGHVSRWLGLASEPTYHLTRWLLGFAALWALYKLTRRIYQDIFWARTAFLLAALGSGLGWLQLIFNWTSTKITPIDFWLIDAYVFFSLSVFPHFAFVTMGMCLVLSLWLDHLEKPRWGNIAWISLMAVLVQFTNPIAFATVDASLAGAMLFSWWKKGKAALADLGALAVVGFVQIPLLTYNLLVLVRDPLWSQFTAQNRTLSPPPDYYLWGFALFWIPAVYGVFIGFREKPSALGAGLAWVAVGFALAYAPFDIQRRFLQNVTIPLALLATRGLVSFFETGSAPDSRWKRWKTSLVILFVFLASISSIQLSLGRMAYLQTHPEDFYYPAVLDDAVEWFRENAQYNDIALAAERTSQILAQRAGLRVYLGHEMETLDYESKQEKVQAFFVGNMPELADKPINWVVYGPLERKLAPDFVPPDNLVPVYDSQDLQIYEVK